MDTDMFCVLCGGPFDLEPGVHNIDSEKPNFQVSFHLVFHNREYNTKLTKK